MPEAVVDELSKEYVLSFYNKKLSIHGDSPEALGWTEQGQAAHYRSLLDVAESIDGRKILDYGCGKGDFYRYLKKRNVAVWYTGFDINERLISLAREKFPEGRFEVFDTDRDLIEENFDYIFLCGVFNLQVQGIDECVMETLKKLFRHCGTALVFNGLSAHNPRRHFELHYFYPEDLLQYALRNLSHSVALRHDRMTFDFTLFVYRDLNRFTG